MSMNSTTNHGNASHGYPQAVRSELDDLLDEILGDQLFLDGFPTQCKKDGRAKPQENAVRRVGGGNGSIPEQGSMETCTSNGKASWESREFATINQTDAQNAHDFRQKSFAADDGIPYPPGAMCAARNRAPSLPVNSCGVERRQRLQSVPFNDFKSRNLGNFYEASDQFVHGLCSEEPITWLDQQKMKLQTRQENRRPTIQSVQQRQLMEELKVAQLLCAQKRTEQELLSYSPEQGYPLFTDSDFSLAEPSVSELDFQCAGYQDGRESAHAQMVAVPPSVMADAECRRGSVEMCKSEKRYYVSGLERPPFTTHQTKYVFSVSSPQAASAVCPDSVSPTHQFLSKPNVKPTPPTPQRGRSSLEAMKLNDWESDRWEQESHTSLSSRSDVAERPVLTTFGKESFPSACSIENPSSQVISTSSMVYLDGGRVLNGTSVGISGNIANGASGNFGGNPALLNGKQISLNDIYADAVRLNGIHGGALSGVGGTSRSMFEPTHSALYDVRTTSGALCSSRSAAEIHPGSLNPVSASLIVATPPSSSSATILQESSSDSALRSRILNQNENSEFRMSDDRQRCVPRKLDQKPTSASRLSPSAMVPPPMPPAFPPVQPGPVSEASFEAKKRDSIHVNNAAGRQLSAITEQPSGGETTEVISLRLVGSGMQKLEPDGELPCIRPITPKFPNPGLNGAFSVINSFNEATRPNGNQRHSIGGKPTIHSGDHKPYDHSARRNTTIAYASRSDSSEHHEEQHGQGRPRSVDMPGTDDRLDKKLKRRRNTTADGQELLRSNGANGLPNGCTSNPESESTSSAYRRTERLLSADFSMQGGAFNRKSSSGDETRRGSKSRNDSENGAFHGKSEQTDGFDDVFALKSKSEAASVERKHDAKSSNQKQKQKEFNLAMLDTALAGLQASANSPSDENSPSQTVLQSPLSGKTTPGFNVGQEVKSPRASIKPLSFDSQTLPTNTDMTAKTSQAPRFVRDSSKYWHKPNISRDETIAYLKDKPPGTFVIRNSNSFPGAFGLALKVAHLPPNVHSRGGDPKAELVRHFLIEPTSKGVKLKGCSTEPVFGSLAALVYQHSLTSLSLPCKLIIPDQSNLKAHESAVEKSESTASEVLSLGAACNVVYVGSVDMESLTGYEAINKAVTTAFGLNPAPLTTCVHFKVSSLGVTLTDTNRKLFFRRHYPVDAVTFAGVDPGERKWTWTNEETKTQSTSKIFGFVARKQENPMDNACHVFAEIDTDQPAEAIVEFIMKVMLGQRKFKKQSV